MGRRRVLHVLGVGLGTASGLSVLTGLAGCNKGGGQGGQGAGASAAAGGKGGACLDKGDIDEAAASLRDRIEPLARGHLVGAHLSCYPRVTPRKAAGKEGPERAEPRGPRVMFCYT